MIFTRQKNRTSVSIKMEEKLCGVHLINILFLLNLNIKFRLERKFIILKFEIIDRSELSFYNYVKLCRFLAVYINKFQVAHCSKLVVNKFYKFSGSHKDFNFYKKLNITREQSFYSSNLYPSKVTK